jgi:hypothetical protein
MIQKSWPCTTQLSVNRGKWLRVSQVNHISSIEKRVKILKNDNYSPIAWQCISWGKRDLDESHVGKVCRNESMVLESWHVLLGAATDLSIASRTLIVSKYSWGAIRVWSDWNWVCWVGHELKQNESMSWTRSEQNRVLIMKWVEIPYSN